MLVILVACRFSYQLLLYANQLSSKRSYEDLAEQAIGKKGKWLIALCTAAMNLGAIVAYLNILADVLSSVAGTIIPPGAEPSRSTYLAGRCSTCMSPLTSAGQCPPCTMQLAMHAMHADHDASLGGKCLALCPA